MEEQYLELDVVLQVFKPHHAVHHVTLVVVELAQQQENDGALQGVCEGAL